MYPAVSIIVAAHNAANTLSETLSSIQAQTFRDFEVVIVDDGSTDQTREIANQLCETDRRFRVISGPATGSAGDARNHGLEASNPASRWINFLDADDVVEPQFLALVVDAGVKVDADVVIFGFIKFDSETGEQLAINTPLAAVAGKPTFAPSEAALRLFQISTPAAWSKLFRADFIRDNPLLRFQSLFSTNDLAFTFTALAYAKRITVLSEQLIRYRQNTSTSISAKRVQYPLEWTEAFSKLKANLQARGLFELFQETFAAQLASTALWQLEQAATYETYTTIYQDIVSRTFPDYGIDDASVSRSAPWLAKRVKTLTKMSEAEWAGKRSSGEKSRHQIHYRWALKFYSMLRGILNRLI